ncbi:MAG: hypothetical protein AABY96_01130 [Nitrospirota bacterium]
MSKAAAIEFLKEQLVAGETERKKTQTSIQTSQARLVQLDAEIQATKLLLAKHTGDKEQLTFPTQSTQYQVPADSGTSVSRLVIQALTESGKPLKTDQLLTFLSRHGKQTSRATLRSTLHLNAKKGTLKPISPGLYGLSEWQQLR